MQMQTKLTNKVVRAESSQGEKHKSNAKSCKTRECKS